MNIEPVANNPRWSARRRRMSRILLGAAVAVGLIVGPVAVAAPAQAATGVSFCLKWSTGAPYASQPVQLQRWDGNKWATIRSGKTNAQGCGTFYRTPANEYLTVVGHVVLDYGGWHEVWSSSVWNWATPGNGGVNIGTGTVSYKYFY